MSLRSALARALCAVLLTGLFGGCITPEEIEGIPKDPYYTKAVVEKGAKKL